jgi:hypothetical protein
MPVVRYTNIYTPAGVLASSASAGRAEASALKVTGPIAGSNLRLMVVSRSNASKIPFGFLHALFYYRYLALLAIEIAVIAFNAVLKSQAVGSRMPRYSAYLFWHCLPVDCHLLIPCRYS